MHDAALGADSRYFAGPTIQWLHDARIPDAEKAISDIGASYLRHHFLSLVT